MNLTNKKSLLIQLSSFFFLSSLLLYLKEDWFSFFLGLIFSYLYIGFFFYSLQTLFFKKRKNLALAFLFAKWFLLLGIFTLVSNYLSLLSFLIGMGIIPALISSYFLEPTQN